MTRDPLLLSVIVALVTKGQLGKHEKPGLGNHETPTRNVAQTPSESGLQIITHGTNSLSHGHERQSDRQDIEAHIQSIELPRADHRHFGQVSVELTIDFPKILVLRK